MAVHNIAGQAAEDEVAKYLKTRGYKILDKNWKTKWCEIDIIARKDKAVHFVEVKYRQSMSQGSGFDYITVKKLAQMRRAAESWVLLNDWEGEYVLSAAEVSGSSFEVKYIEEI